MPATNTTLGTVQLAGDLTGEATAPLLSTTGVTAGTFTNPVIQVDAKGRILSASTGSAIDVFNVANAGPGQKGAVIVGAGISVSSGTISVPTATSGTPGLVTVSPGSGLTLNTSTGEVSVDTSMYPSLATGGTFTGAVITEAVEVPAATGAVTLDFAASNTFDVTLVGDVSLQAPSNLTNGGTYFIVFEQDGTGSRVITFDSAYVFSSGSPTTLSTAAGAIDLMRVVVLSSTKLLCTLYKNFL